MAPGVLVTEATETFGKYAVVDEEKVESVHAQRSYDLPVESLKAFWQTEPHALHDHRSTEQLPEHSDIIIIGAGYAGVSVAHHLAKDAFAAHKSITMLEARGACSGATGRNGGHMRPDLYSHIGKYCDIAGVEAGVEVADFEISHVQAFKKLVDEENIDCDFTLTRSYDVWCNEVAAKAAQANYERMKARNLSHMDDVVFYSGKNVEGVCCTTLVFSLCAIQQNKVKKLIEIDLWCQGRTSLLISYSWYSLALQIRPSLHRQARLHPAHQSPNPYASNISNTFC